VNLLLDTHTLLWIAEDDPSLSPTAASLITDPQNSKFVSIASLWEIAIKVSIGKLGLRQPFEGFVNALNGTPAITILPIADVDLIKVAQLPFHHRDPFDRLLAAQALTRGMAVVGEDAAFELYGVTRLW
jgi:PIN domain nuclease of toxin-antitoxin system